jgi:hypothetical protein
VRSNGRKQEAEQLYRQSLAIGERVANMDPGDLWHAHMPAACCYHLGDLLLETKRHKEADQVYRRAIEEYKTLLAKFPGPSYIHEEFNHVLRQHATLLKPAAAQEK